MTPIVQFEGDLLRVRFEVFDIASYAMFLRVKRLPEVTIEFDRLTETYAVSAPARFAKMLGIEAPERAVTELPFASFLFEDQVATVRLALDAKRFAVWSGCGLGKTPIALEWARHVIHRTAGRVLIVTLNEIVPQFIEECRKFYGDSLPIRRIESRQEMRDWAAGRIDGSEMLAITNYEKLNPDDQGQEVHELRMLAGFALDEASRLKTGGGKQKWAIIKSTKGIQYKIALTATPAPNDTMEFASQASFLEKMRSEGEIIWTYFTRHPKTHRWMVKPHARKPFFEFMSGWSIYVRNPKRYGWRLNMPDVPEPVIFQHTIALTDAQREFIFNSSVKKDTGQGSMFGEPDMNTIQRNKHSQVAKGFVYVEGKADRVQRIASDKPNVVAQLIAEEAAHGLQVLVWTVFDAETDILMEEVNARRLDGVAVLTGETKEDDRVRILEDFRQGRIRVLISRANMLGYGMNFQNCGSMIFSGWNDSFESWYQAIRRAFRFGQTLRLRVHVPVVPELEGHQLENIRRKNTQFEADIDEMERNYLAAFHSTGLLGRAA